MAEQCTENGDDTDNDNDDVDNTGKRLLMITRAHFDFFQKSQHKLVCDSYSA